MGRGKDEGCCIIQKAKEVTRQQETDMLTKIVLDEELVKRAQKITGIESEGEAVQEALRALFSMQEKAEHPVADSHPQDEVVKSLERSLIENEDIWSELAKH